MCSAESPVELLQFDISMIFLIFLWYFSDISLILKLIICSNIWLFCLIVVFSPGGTASLWYQPFPFWEQSWPNLIWISLKNFYPEFQTSFYDISLIFLWHFSDISLIFLLSRFKKSLAGIKTVSPALLWGAMLKLLINKFVLETFQLWRQLKIHQIIFFK